VHHAGVEAGRSPAGPPPAGGSARCRRPMRSSAAWARSGMSSRWFSSTSIEAQRGQRRAQLVAHVGREAGVALEPLLHGRGHLVEGVGQRGQVGVVAGLDPGLELAGGDGLGGLADAAQRAQHRGAPPTNRPRRRPACDTARRRAARCRATRACPPAPPATRSRSRRRGRTSAARPPPAGSRRRGRSACGRLAEATMAAATPAARPRRSSA
jgi:hypothetical protein